MNEKFEVRLMLCDITFDSHVVNGLLHIPRAGDLIDPLDMLDENLFTDKQYSEIFDQSWSVWYVSWGKDKNGFYAQVVCQGE